MNARIRIAVYTTLAGFAMLSMSCSDDNAVAPAAVEKRETKLAMYQASFSGTNSVEPQPPHVASIEFGVFNEELTSFDPPDVVLFSNREFADGDQFTANAFNTADFGEIVNRLTDSFDRNVYIDAQTESAGTTSFGIESLVFQYTNPTRPGPDLAGSEITGIRVTIDLAVTENAGMWSTELTYVITILGH